MSSTQNNVPVCPTDCNVNPLEVEFRRDERFMRYLTVKLDKHAISWAERRRVKLQTKA